MSGHLPTGLVSMMLVLLLVRSSFCLSLPDGCILSMGSSSERIKLLRAFCLFGQCHLQPANRFR